MAILNSLFVLNKSCKYINLGLKIKMAKYLLRHEKERNLIKSHSYGMKRLVTCFNIWFLDAEKGRNKNIFTKNKKFFYKTCYALFMPRAPLKTSNMYYKKKFLFFLKILESLFQCGTIRLKNSLIELYWFCK